MPASKGKNISINPVIRCFFIEILFCEIEKASMVHAAEPKNGGTLILKFSIFPGQGKSTLVMLVISDDPLTIFQSKVLFYVNTCLHGEKKTESVLAYFPGRFFPNSAFSEYFQLSSLSITGQLVFPYLLIAIKRRIHLGN